MDIDLSHCYDDFYIRSADSLRFLHGLYNTDPEMRKRALARIREALDGWVDGYGSPPSHMINSGTASSFSATDMSELVREQLPDLLRLSIDCPFEDVRIGCSDYLQDLEDRCIRIPKRTVYGVSTFIPSSDMIPIEDEAEQTRALLVDAFLQNNRLEHLLQVMAYHPQYLECFLKTQHFLMRGDGPLPYHHRHYIAIMAAARHRCSYLMHIHTLEFLLQGGDETWLRGVKYVPEKLSSLSTINRILAHTPWLINKDHIKELATGENKWSLAELMQALVLLAHFHAVSSFVFGCGISSEIDQPSGHHVKPCDGMGGKARTNNQQRSGVMRGNSSNGDEGQAGCSAGGDCSNGQATSCHCVKQSNSTEKLKCSADNDTSIELLMKKMKCLTRDGLSVELQPANEEEMRESFERVESQNVCDCCSCSSSSNIANNTFSQPDQRPIYDSCPDTRTDLTKDAARFVDDPSYCYQDRKRSGGGTNCSRRAALAVSGGGRGVATFCTSDFSWEHEGYSLSCRLYMEVGELLEEKFRVAKNLTYYTMGDNEEVDTTSFRHAIWNYVHCLYAIRHVEYDYSVVNQLLDQNLKSFIRTVVCFPDSVTRKQYDSFMCDFKHSEKVHVNLMLLESRMQSELLYGLRALSKYMCARDPAPTPESANHISPSPSPPLSPS